MAAPNSKEEETKTREISSDSSTDDLEPQWVSGLPLVNMMVALSIVMFLVLLDGSIIGTVRAFLLLLSFSLLMIESLPATCLQS